MKDNFKLVEKYITEEIVKSHLEYIYTPKKYESQLNNFITFVLETQNTDSAKPYVFCFYGLGKIVGRYNRDLTPHEIKRCKKDTIAFDGDSCVINASDFCWELKSEEKNTKK